MSSLLLFMASIVLYVDWSVVVIRWSKFGRQFPHVWWVVISCLLFEGHLSPCQARHPAALNLAVVPVFEKGIGRWAVDLHSVSRAKSSNCLFRWAKYILICSSTSSWVRRKQNKNLWAAVHLLLAATLKFPVITSRVPLNQTRHALLRCWLNVHLFHYFHFSCVLSLEVIGVYDDFF